jgi:cytoskeletal protein CcmA (bactofilin family)
MPSWHSVLGPDVEIKGSIRFSQDLVIDGKVIGDVRSDGTLTVGAHAFIKGQIKTRTVIIFGHVEGNITTQERCELRNTATLVGDIAAGTLVIEEGAAFLGHCQVGKHASAIKSAPAAKPLEIVHGNLSEETGTPPAAVVTTLQAA